LEKILKFKEKFIIILKNHVKVEVSKSSKKNLKVSKKKILAKGQAQHLAHASIANQAHVCSSIFIYFFKK